MCSAERDHRVRGRKSGAELELMRLAGEAPAGFRAVSLR